MSKDVQQETLGRELWARFNRGELDGEERRQLVRSLLAAGVWSESLAPSRPALDPLGRPFEGLLSDYGSANSAAADLSELESSLAGEEREARALLAELENQPVARQQLLAVDDARFHSWELCRLLLGAATEACFDQPQEAIRRAELGVSIAAELGSRRAAPAELAADLRARAWATLANARRVSSDLRGADRAFELAFSLLAKGTGEPLERARLLELRASRDLDVHRLAEAEKGLSEAASLYRRAGSTHAAGRVEISRGLLASRREDPARAIRHLEKGLAAIDREREPRLERVALHNLCFCWSEQGDVARATEVLAEVRRLHQVAPLQVDQVRLVWLEGRIALAAGDLAAAIASFESVRRDCIRLELAYDAALVSLDLAAAYARQGRAREMRRLAEEILPIFRSRELGREVVAALLVLQDATRREGASAGLIEELSTLLKTARSDSDPVP